MDPYERYYRRSLRDTLVGQGLLAAEQADELSESAFANHEPFGLVVVEAGLVTAYDLLKVVATHYQMPVIPLAGYEIDPALAQTISPSLLYQYHALPIGRFGHAWSFAVLEPPTRECIDALREACEGPLFFFAASAAEMRPLLSENVKVVDVASDRQWESLFDDGDEAVRDSLRSPA
jgi:type IV pilus assembly protein PilB